MKIKICGLTAPKEAVYLNENQVDFAGFVLFFPKSKRNITIDQAKDIFMHLSSSIKKVAVVVSPTLAQAKEIETAGFDYIQIHGVLPKELLTNLRIPILKAFNIDDMEHYPDYVNQPSIAGFVFDANEPGSGKTFDWNLLRSLPKNDKLMFLAGGLHADNVTAAIEAVSPDVVDVSSGVELGEGIGKDPNKINAFVKAVRQ
ncbi:MAG: phosphoribosylanthranilate isomerase [Clostridiales bacterium]|nr:phosphoribosylanthranilate isomerase [Clostridiales bacterium]